MFTDVTQDDEFVYFTLYNGTVLIVPRGVQEQKVQIVDGAIMAEYSVSETKKVYFSQGNLQYSSEGTHLCADGTNQPGTWNFAEKQWDQGMFFYWGNSGYNDTIKQILASKQAEETMGMSYFSAYQTIAQANISNTYNDWGVYNAISNGGNTPDTWRTLTKDEWIYLWEQRENADKLKGTTKVDGVECTYLLPDSWTDFEAKIPSALYSSEQIFDVFPSVTVMLNKGVVFFRKNAKKSNLSDNSGSGYWSSTYTRTHTYGNRSIWYYAYAILGDAPDSQMTYYNTTSGVSEPYVAYCPVRLVKDVE